MKAYTQKQIAVAAGITTRTLRDWRNKEGVNIENLEEVLRRAKKKKTPGISTTWIPVSHHSKIIAEYNREARAFPDWSSLIPRQHDGYTKNGRERIIMSAYSKELKAFPCWSKHYLSAWRKNQKAKARYHNMTPEERYEHNKKHQQSLKDSPKRYHKHLASRRSYRKKRLKENPTLRIQQSLRARLNKVLKGGRSHTIKSLLGCSHSKLVKHLEEQFQQGMTWQNYGLFWHIDHIIPCSHFNHTDPEQVAKCWHYSNLQPLTATENCQKQDRWIG